MTSRVLVIGGGGRENALVWKIAQSPNVGEIFACPGNAGTSLEEKTKNVVLDVKNHNEIVSWCKDNKIALVVVGPEAPLADGISDTLMSNDIACFGPSKLASQIESSKAFAKAFMQRHDIPTARWQTFTNSEEAVRRINDASYPALVVKASGLAAGKGVIVAETKEEAIKSVKEMIEALANINYMGSSSMTRSPVTLHQAEDVYKVQTFCDRKFGEAGASIVLEEKLSGEEISVLAFTDGTTIAAFPPAQDFKRLLDGDNGPNTGGMGAYCPVSHISQTVIQRIHNEVIQKAVDGMREEGYPFVGMLYAGLMMTRDGPKVLEFNCRFGDPETQVLLSLFSSDLYTTMMKCVKGDLASAMPKFNNNQTAVTVVAASGGYPGSYKKGLKISGISEAQNKPNVKVFHAGTTLVTNGEGIEEIVTSGGRVLATTGTGRTLDEAKTRAYGAMQCISFGDMFYRKDIAEKVARITRSVSYFSSGVDIDNSLSLVESIKPLAGATARPGCSPDLGGFGGLFDLAACGFKDPILVSGTDGVGTKLRVAQICGIHTTVGIDLVAMCVNDILAQGAEPLFFLDYFACGKLDAEVAKQVITGVAQGCAMAGCALLGGETAEMPGMYGQGEYDLAGFAVGAVERDHVIPTADSIQPEDVVIGVGSSGLHSNGFSLVRKIVEMSQVSYTDPCPFQSDNGNSLGEELLTPTKIYVKPFMQLLKERKIKAFAHITGGGLLDNVPRVLSPEIAVDIDANCWDIPPVFGWLAGVGRVNHEEMARTFNCGLGAVIVINPQDTIEVMERLKHSGERVWRIGNVIKRSSNENQVNIKNLRSSLDAVIRNSDILSTLGSKRLRLSSGSDKRMRIGVLISGSGTNLQALIDQSLRLDSSAEIVLVISNMPDVQGLKRAEKAGIPTKVINHKSFGSRLEFDMTIHSALQEPNVQLVCLAGFMRILTGEFVRKWRGRLVNVHPSLLPSFKGANAHKLVLEAGVRISGCTVHFVEEEVDAGAIIAQEAVPVYPTDTIEVLQERVKAAEHKAYPQAMELLASRKVRMKEDGKVEWHPLSGDV